MSGRILAKNELSVEEDKMNASIAVAGDEPGKG
jgi:hypothetical protein